MVDAHACSFSAEELVDKLDVSLLGVFLGLALSGIPGLPLGLALKVEHAGLAGVAVTEGALLEERVDLKLLLVGERISNGSIGFEFLGSSLKFFLEGH
jgi:hypothetical protein